MGRIIVFAGEAGHGKDTAADVLVRAGWHRLPLAKPLKDMLAGLLETRGTQQSHIERCLNGDLKETPSEFLNGQTPRIAMQRLGTEWGRGLSQTLWLDTWRDTREHIYHPDSDLVVTDCRFENEAAYLKKLGAEVYLVKRPGFTKTVAAHSSEDLSWAADEPVIWNDAPTVEAFQAVVRAQFFPAE
jgi:hypothetical protein